MDCKEYILGAETWEEAGKRTHELTSAAKSRADRLALLKFLWEDAADEFRRRAEILAASDGKRTDAYISAQIGVRALCEQKTRLNLGRYKYEWTGLIGFDVLRIDGRKEFRLFEFGFLQTDSDVFDRVEVRVQQCKDLDDNRYRSFVAVLVADSVIYLMKNTERGVFSRTPDVKFYVQKGGSVKEAPSGMFPSRLRFCDRVP